MTAPARGPGRLQCNLAILPGRYAADFEAWCRANPRVGDPHLPALGADIDLRTDLPGYSIFRCGVTPQLAIRQAAPDLCIAHRSAHMLVTDIPMQALRDRMPEAGSPFLQGLARTG